MAAPRIKLTGSLADIAALRKRPSVLLGRIYEHLVAENAKPSTRRQDILHPSEMSADDWCPRQTYYRIRDVRSGLPHVGEKFSAQTLMIFEEGHAIHHKWQTWLKNMGLLYGRQTCLSCGLKSAKSVKAFVDCPTCKSPTMRYDEVPLSAEETHLIVGHADGYVPDFDALIEIKSVGLGTLRMDVPDLLREYTVETITGAKITDLDAVWRNLHEPLAPHVRQGTLYIWMAQLAGLNVEKMIFLYESKANQQVKEFTIGLDHQVLDPMLNSALEIKTALEGAALPPDRNHRQDSVKCKKCPFAEECWNADPDPAPEPGQETRRSARRRHPAGTGAPGREGTPAPRPAGRRETDDPGRRDRARRRRADDPVPGDGGLEPVRLRTVRHRGSRGEDS